MGSAAQFSGPAVTPDLAYTEITLIRSLADRDRAPRAVKLVTALRRVPGQLRPGKLRGKRLVDKPGRTAVTPSRPWLRVLWPAAAYSRRERLGLVSSCCVFLALR
jgi:hypothetical protein